MDHTVKLGARAPAPPPLAHTLGSRVSLVRFPPQNEPALYESVAALCQNPTLRVDVTVVKSLVELVRRPTRPRRRACVAALANAVLEPRGVELPADAVAMIIDVLEARSDASSGEALALMSRLVPLLEVAGQGTVWPNVCRSVLAASRLLQDGAVIAAAQREDLTRELHDQLVPVVSKVVAVAASKATGATVPPSGLEQRLAAAVDGLWKLRTGKDRPQSLEQVLSCLPTGKLKHALVRGVESVGGKLALTLLCDGAVIATSSGTRQEVDRAVGNIAAAVVDALRLPGLSLTGQPAPQVRELCTALLTKLVTDVVMARREGSAPDTLHEAQSFTRVAGPAIQALRQLVKAGAAATHSNLCVLTPEALAWLSQAFNIPQPILHGVVMLCSRMVDVNDLSLIAPLVRAVAGPALRDPIGSSRDLMASVDDQQPRWLKVSLALVVLVAGNTRPGDDRLPVERVKARIKAAARDLVVEFLPRPRGWDDHAVGCVEAAAWLGASRVSDSQHVTEVAGSIVSFCTRLRQRGLVITCPPTQAGAGDPVAALARKLRLQASVSRSSAAALPRMLAVLLDCRVMTAPLFLTELREVAFDLAEAVRDEAALNTTAGGAAGTAGGEASQPEKIDFGDLPIVDLLSLPACVDPGIPAAHVSDVASRLCFSLGLSSTALVQVISAADPGAGLRGVVPGLVAYLGLPKALESVVCWSCVR